MCLPRSKAGSGAWNYYEQKEEEQNAEYRACVGGRCRYGGSVDKRLRQSGGSRSHGLDFSPGFTLPFQISYFSSLNISNLICSPRPRAIPASQRQAVESVWHTSGTDSGFYQLRWG